MQLSFYLFHAQNIDEVVTEAPLGPLERKMPAEQADIETGRYSLSVLEVITTFQFNAAKDKREFIGSYAEFDEPESSEAWQIK